MPLIDLAEFNALVSNGGYAGNADLSNATVLVALLFLNNATSKRYWKGASYSLTQAEIDEIDEIVSNAIGELQNATI